MQCERGQRKEDTLEESMAPAEAQEPKVLEALGGWQGGGGGVARADPDAAWVQGTFSKERSMHFLPRAVTWAMN